MLAVNKLMIEYVAQLQKIVKGTHLSLNLKPDAGSLFALCFLQ
jgi:hypothetical protein